MIQSTSSATLPTSTDADFPFGPPIGESAQSSEVPFPVSNSSRPTAEFAGNWTFQLAGKPFTVLVDVLHTSWLDIIPFYDISGGGFNNVTLLSVYEQFDKIDKPTRSKILHKEVLQTLALAREVLAESTEPSATASVQRRSGPPAGSDARPVLPPWLARYDGWYDRSSSRFFVLATLGAFPLSSIPVVYYYFTSLTYMPHRNGYDIMDAGINRVLIFWLTAYAVYWAEEANLPTLQAVFGWWLNAVVRGFVVGKRCAGQLGRLGRGRGSRGPGDSGSDSGSETCQNRRDWQRFQAVSSDSMRERLRRALSGFGNRLSTPDDRNSPPDYGNSPPDLGLSQVPSQGTSQSANYDLNGGQNMLGQWSNGNGGTFQYPSWGAAMELTELGESPGYADHSGGSRVQPSGPSSATAPSMGFRNPFLG